MNEPTQPTQPLNGTQPATLSTRINTHTWEFVCNSKTTHSYYNGKKRGILTDVLEYIKKELQSRLDNNLIADGTIFNVAMYNNRQSPIKLQIMITNNPDLLKAEIERIQKLHAEAKQTAALLVQAETIINDALVQCSQWWINTMPVGDNPYLSDDREENEKHFAWIKLQYDQVCAISIDDPDDPNHGDSLCAQFISYVQFENLLLKNIIAEKEKTGMINKLQARQIMVEYQQWYENQLKYNALAQRGEDRN